MALVTFRILSLTNKNNKEAGGAIGGVIGGAIGGAIDNITNTMALTESQLAVFNLIKDNPSISYRKISEVININQSAVLKHLDVLKRKGIIKRIGGTRGYWKIDNNE
ncbi:MAG: winged helix-turn-helix domain-containing protein [Proteiniphilum sp.]